MSSKKISPTANILRRSRLFSLPSPLPRPATTTSTHPSTLAPTTNKVSDTATLPHPVQQAIATPPSSQARGDWGLKRPLPLKSTTKTGTPFVRVNALDTQEHITDFDSAADLHLTAVKFHELGLPLTVAGDEHSGANRQQVKSAFEPDGDHTDVGPRSAAGAGQRRTRWKFGGPWLAGLTQGEFLAYMGGTLRGRKQEFLDFVREKEMERVRAVEDIKAKSVAGHGQRLNVKEGLTDDEFDEHLRRLRADFDVKSDLASLLSEFLDLPGVPSADEHVADGGKKINARGPPATHPSAGLSYLRTDAVLTNHPILGPLARPPPQQARVLAEHRKFGGPNRQGHLGIAGFVAPDAVRIRVPVEAKRDIEPGTKNDAFITKETSAQTMGIATEGGNRVWAEPTQAQVDERGQVQLTLGSTDHEQVAGHHDGGELMNGVALSERGGFKTVEPAQPLDTGSQSALGRWRQGVRDLRGDGPARSRNVYGIGNA